VIESIAILLLDNRTFGIDCQDLFSSWVNTSESDFTKRSLGGGTYLQLACKSIEKEREEDESSTIVEAGCIRLEVVEHASQDERHHDVKQKGSDGEPRVS
jgi:hypothetical protein